MEITLFGGAFNPPHLGHLLVIQQAFELIPELGELWVLPCYRHTFQKQLAPASTRLAMTHLLLKNLPPDLTAKVKVETSEIDQKLSGETYIILQILKQKYPAHTFSFLMGSDQLPAFTKWGHWQELLNQMPFYIYPRAGYEQPISYPHMTLLASETQAITNLSSTLIRERIKKRLCLDHLMPKTIVQYIKENQIYDHLST